MKQGFARVPVGYCGCLIAKFYLVDRGLRHRLPGLFPREIQNRPVGFPGEHRHVRATSFLGVCSHHAFFQFVRGQMCLLMTGGHLKQREPECLGFRVQGFRLACWKDTVHCSLIELQDDNLAVSTSPPTHTSPIGTQVHLIHRQSATLLEEDRL